MEHKKLHSLEEINERFDSVKNIHHRRISRQLSTIDKLAIWITNRVGSMGFFLIIFTWTILWLTWNTFAPASMRFDAFPGFVLWLFISNMIQIFLMPLIMVGQNLQGEGAEARAEADYQINMKAEFEIENIMKHLERQDALLTKILQKLEAGENK